MKHGLNLRWLILLLLVISLAHPAHSKFYSLEKARSPKNSAGQFKSLRSAKTGAISLPQKKKSSYSLKRYKPLLRSITAIKEHNSRHIAEKTKQSQTVASLKTDTPKATTSGPKIVTLHDDGSSNIRTSKISRPKATPTTSKKQQIREARIARLGGEIHHHWPIDRTANHYISSLFGLRSDPYTSKQAFHAGLDIAAPKGTDVLASARGKVTGLGTHPRLGRYVKVTHKDDSYSLYGHLSDTNVLMGDRVTARQKIAEVGSTGRSTGNHLDYSLRINGKPVDPLEHITPPRNIKLAKGLHLSEGGD